MTDSQPFPPTYLIAVIAAIIWALEDFHSPFSAREIQCSTRRLRYLIARGVYAGVAVVGFTFVYRFLDIPIVTLSYGSQYRWLSACATLLVCAGMLRVAAISKFRSAVRESCQSLALYPYARDRLTALLSRSRLSAEVAEIALLEREFGRYGVKPDLLKTRLSEPARQRLLEIEVLKGRSALIFSEGNARTFVGSRQDRFNEIDTRRRRLLRRAARTMKWTQEFPWLLFSEFIAEDAEECLVMHRFLIAEAAISTQSSLQGALQFVKRFGFDIAEGDEGVFVPPIVPLSIAFVSYCLLFSFPLLLVRLKVIHVPQFIGLEVFLQFLIPQAVGQIAAICFAVLPFRLTGAGLLGGANISLTSIFGLGLASYIVGLAVSLSATFGAFADVYIVLRNIAIFSLLYPTVTIALCIAIRSRVRNNMRGYPPRSSLLDALGFSMLFFSENVLLQGVVNYLATNDQQRALGWPYWLAWAAFGAVIGGTLPSTAVAYLTFKRAGIEYDRDHGPFNIKNLPTSGRA